MNNFNRKIELYKKIRGMTNDEFKDFINEKTATKMAQYMESDIRYLGKDKAITNYVRYIPILVVVGDSVCVHQVLIYYPTDVIFKGIDHAVKRFKFTCTVEINLSNCEEYKECPFVVYKYENGKLVEKAISPTSMIA